VRLRRASCAHLASAATTALVEVCLSYGIQAAIGAAIGVLSRGGAMPAAQQAAEAAAAAAGAAAVQNMPEELDEFGRDMNVEKRRQVSNELRCFRACFKSVSPRS